MGVLFVIAIIVAALIYLAKPPPKKPTKTPSKDPVKPHIVRRAIFHKRAYFFGSAQERNFFNKLSRAIDRNKYVVFAQVRLADLIRTPFDGPEYSQAYLKTLPYHVDFVVCQLPQYKVCLAVELDSPHHSNAKQMERDLFKTQVLEEAKIPLLRFRVEEELTPTVIQNRMQPYLHKVSSPLF